jgi:hypothetical protein
LELDEYCEEDIDDLDQDLDNEYNKFRNYYDDDELDGECYLDDNIEKIYVYNDDKLGVTNHLKKEEKKVILDSRSEKKTELKTETIKSGKKNPLNDLFDCKGKTKEVKESQDKTNKEIKDKKDVRQEDKDVYKEPKKDVNKKDITTEDIKEMSIQDARINNDLEIIKFTDNMNKMNINQNARNYYGQNYQVNFEEFYNPESISRGLQKQNNPQDFQDYQNMNYNQGYYNNMQGYDMNFNMQNYQYNNNYNKQFKNKFNKFEQQPYPMNYQMNYNLTQQYMMNYMQPMQNQYMGNMNNVNYMQNYHRPNMDGNKKQ